MGELSLFVDHDALKAIKQTAESVVQSGLLPSHIKNAQQAVAIILKGRELGLPPMASLAHIYVVHGKAELEGTLMQAVLQERGVAIRTISNTDQECELEMVRAIAGERVVERYKYTIKKAERAGLIAKNENYKRNPEDMLYWRCLSYGARRIGADLLHGCYVKGEIADLPPEAFEARAVTLPATEAPKLPDGPSLVERIDSCVTMGKLMDLAGEVSKADQETREHYERRRAWFEQEAQS